MCLLTINQIIITIWFDEELVNHLGWHRKLLNINKKNLFIYFFILLLQVLNKNENTSAIYRLKISEKYAFVQTQSKLIAHVSDNDSTFRGGDDCKEQEEMIIFSLHSIIK